MHLEPHKPTNPSFRKPAHQNPLKPTSMHLEPHKPSNPLPEKSVRLLRFFCFAPSTSESRATTQSTCSAIIAAAKLKHNLDLFSSHLSETPLTLLQQNTEASLKMIPHRHCCQTRCRREETRRSHAALEPGDHAPVAVPENDTPAKDTNTPKLPQVENAHTLINHRGSSPL